MSLVMYPATHLRLMGQAFPPAKHIVPSLHQVSILRRSSWFPLQTPRLDMAIPLIKLQLLELRRDTILLDIPAEQQLEATWQRIPLRHTTVKPARRIIKK